MKTTQKPKGSAAPVLAAAEMGRLDPAPQIPEVVWVSIFLSAR